MKSNLIKLIIVVCCLASVFCIDISVNAEELSGTLDGGKTEWQVVDKSLYIDGNGDMEKKYESDSLIPASVKANIEYIRVTGSFGKLKNSYGYNNLKKIDFNASLSIIGDGGGFFGGNENIEEINLNGEFIGDIKPRARLEAKNININCRINEISAGAFSMLRIYT